MEKKVHLFRSQSPFFLSFFILVQFHLLHANNSIKHTACDACIFTGCLPITQSSHNISIVKENVLLGDTCPSPQHGEDIAYCEILHFTMNCCVGLAIHLENSNFIQLIIQICLQEVNDTYL